MAGNWGVNLGSLGGQILSCNAMLPLEMLAVFIVSITLFSTGSTLTAGLLVS